ALVIAVLRAANLVAPRPGRGVASVPEAIRGLELRGLEILVSRIPAVDFFQRSPAWRTPAERFRLHALAVQAAAGRLADELGHEDADELAVAALLHDVGKLVLVDAYPGYPERVHGSAATPEELEAVRGLAEGKLYKEIAAALGVTTSTIRSHLHAAYRKMGAADRAQAVLIAAERGWL